jgi:trimethylamine---corrinoid protein Co-methyltransferase
MKDLPPHGIESRLKVLSDEKCQKIYDAALTIVAEIGMTVPHTEARDILVNGAGATVEADDLVKIPRDAVAAARDTIPAMIHVYDRNGEPAMQLGGYNSYFGTGSDLMSIYDFETGERRLSLLADTARMAHLCDGLPNIDFIMSAAHPHDVPAYASYLECYRQMVTNTTKPMVMTAAGVNDLEVMWKIACAFRGGEEELRSKPYFIQYGEPVSPLQHAPEVLDKLLFCADKGIPLIYSPAPIAGATSPMTQAGHIVQAVAESLFGAVIHQLRVPGAPLLTGMGPVKLDMNTFQALYNSAEYYTTILGICEMGKWMDIPNWGYAGTSDSQCVDANAGIDITELTLLSMQAGSNLNHDIGYLDFGLTGAGELVVLTDEVIAMNRRTLEGIEVSNETLGLDVIAEVGQGGDFLRKKHTKQFVRGQQWKPTILNRDTQKNWEVAGAPTATDKAHRKLLDIMADHVPEPLRPELRQTVDELVDAYVAAGA